MEGLTSPPPQDHHKHKQRKDGRGAKEKKKDKQAKEKGTRVEKHNSRAFGVANVGRTKRNIQRNLDKSQKKEYVPLQDRRSAVLHETPPALIVVMGPKGVGKSTLIRSLVKLYTQQNLTTVTGPITVITGKKKRMTFFECPNDTSAMLDCAKIADMVLLCVDAKFGFEMETFEFLNVLQTHGFPKVMGVFTHLDQFRTVKNLSKTKKLLKQRFWTEIYDGAKMIYLSGVINGKYLKNEVKQLHLFLSRAKVSKQLLLSQCHHFCSVVPSARRRIFLVTSSDERLIESFAAFGGISEHCFRCFIYYDSCVALLDISNEFSPPSLPPSFLVPFSSDHLCGEILTLILLWTDTRT